MSINIIVSNKFIILYLIQKSNNLGSDWMDKIILQFLLFPKQREFFLLHLAFEVLSPDQADHTTEIL